MPIQAPQWTDFLSCPVCYNEFDGDSRSPVSLGCGHTVCRACLQSLHRKQCPFDQSHIRVDVLKVPANTALLRLVGVTACPSDIDNIDNLLLPTYNVAAYRRAVRCIEELALYLRPFTSGSVSVLSRPMQRKLVTLANCQLLESEGRARALRAARSLGERTVTELLLQHQNPQQLSANLWAAVRARGCQFLGPAMQEEVLRLVLLALEDGTALSRKVLVMFVVQRLEPHYSQASKTSIGHVVQLLYRASCFKVSKREGDSSLMQLKEEFRSYEALRREHDAQIVQIATEAGLRIAPDQWSSLLYGDTTHKSHMQSIMDKLQTPQSFSQSVQELVMALQRSGDPAGLAPLRPQLEYLANIDPSPEAPTPSWDETTRALDAARVVVAGLADFVTQHGGGRRVGAGCSDAPHTASKYKVSMCRDLTLRGSCPRGPNCTFAHSDTELDRFRPVSAAPRTSGGHRKVGQTVGEPLRAVDTGVVVGGDVVGGASRLFTSSAVGFDLGAGGVVLPTPQSAPPPAAAFAAATPAIVEPAWIAKAPRNVNLSPAQRYKYLLATGAAQSIDTNDLTGDGFIHDFNNPYDNAIHCDSLMNVSLGAPPWPNIASSSKLPLDLQDVHYFIQPSQGLIDFNGQMQSIEQKIFDLQLGESSRHNNNNNNIVEELRRFQENLDEEELYEANIAEDMKEMEQRWECEWNEQERQWSEPEPSKSIP